MKLTADTAQRVLAELETAEAASAVNELCRENVGAALARLVELMGSAANPRIREAAGQRLGRELQQVRIACDALQNSGSTRISTPLQEKKIASAGC
jgi:hypothetical protein